MAFQEIDKERAEYDLKRAKTAIIGISVVGVAFLVYGYFINHEVSFFGIFFLLAAVVVFIARNRDLKRYKNKYRNYDKNI